MSLACLVDKELTLKSVVVVKGLLASANAKVTVVRHLVTKK
ncbi:hypothetical protein [Prochlorococcus sp. MIT 0801]|nr:hypothetical protein [Prochlorococcus sp. MIT 0801]AIQ96731.1 hypothetical protein EW15_0639 [Prochlorococcus sp. MIT 0801]